MHRAAAAASLFGLLGDVVYESVWRASPCADVAVHRHLRWRGVSRRRSIACTEYPSPYSYLNLSLRRHPRATRAMTAATDDARYLSHRTPDIAEGYG